jgi:uncharacterized protein (TIGR02594 family)
LSPQVCRFPKSFDVLPQLQGKYEMIRSARPVIGLVLLAMAAPSTSFADSDRFGTEAPYRQLDAQAPREPSDLRKAFRDRLAKLGGTFPASIAPGNPRWVSVAQQYKGTNPTGRRSLWCADFVNLVLERSGMEGTSSSMARSFASYGQRISGPRVGAIAVISRGKTAGHVGIVTGIDDRGNPILISGNYNDTVAEAPYPAGRIIAYVWPTGS